MRDRVRRASLVVLAAWVGALLAARLLHVAGTAASLALPLVPDQGGWVPQRPLDEWTYRAERLANWAGLLTLPALVALGTASWGERAARMRFLVAFGIADALLVFVTLDNAHLEWHAYGGASLVLYGARTMLVVAGGVALCWGAPRGRVLALLGALAIALHEAGVWSMNGVFPWPWPNVDAVLLTVYFGTWLLDAAGLALMAGALLFASGPWRAAAPPPPGEPEPARTL